MLQSQVSEEYLQLAQRFFEREVCQKGTGPLSNLVEIALYLDGNGPCLLTKRNDRTMVLAESPKKADMSFWVPVKALQELSATQTEEVGEIGVAILKLMANKEPELHIRAKVHIGIFDLLRHGYLGVLPLGGATVMKFLASKGFSGLSKIKEAIARLRE